MGKNEFKNLEKKMVLHCESCGGFHPEEECEYIIIKIVKGKNCSLDQSKLLNSVPRQTTTPTISEVAEPVAPVVTPTAAAIITRRQKSIIPASLRKAFQEPPELQRLV